VELQNCFIDLTALEYVLCHWSLFFLYLFTVTYRRRQYFTLGSIASKNKTMKQEMSHDEGDQ
jgi:hypothetical protein